MVLLPVSGSVAEMVMQANPGVFHNAMIKKGEYPGLSEDVETLAVTAVLATLDTLPDEKLTAILNAVFDHKIELSSVWKGAADLTPEKSVAVLAPETRKYLHPVAAAVFDQRETLYQIATINALRAGQYDGITTLGWLKQQGNLGFGTFDGLDGEMILLDGVVYQAKATGLVELPADDVETPFATVTRFDADITADLGVGPDMASLHAALDKLIERKDAFYAIRIDGLFQQVQVRSVPKQQKPYPELVTALENQTVFEYQNIEGTIVGFWCPDYVGEVNQQGYHLHFISGDHTRGGHLLEAAVTSAQVSLDETRMFDMALRPADD
ncbi:MAG: acetolactate decarboxylase [Flexilinea sp.]